MIGNGFGLRGTLQLVAAPLVALTLSVGLVAAQDTATVFEPPESDEFDWIQIVSDEWLKGEIIAMYDGSLEFDSDELDELVFDFEDVKRIRSAGPMQVGLLDGGAAIGRLSVDGDEVRVVGDQEQTMDRSQVLSITSGAPKERSYWSGKVGAGANIRQGNTDQIETNTQASFMRRSVRNRIAFDYLANFSRTDETTLTDNQRATVGWDRFVSDRFYLSPVFGEYFRDPFQNIAHRFTIGGGAGYQIVDSAKVDWQATVGIAYQNTRFDDVAEGDPTSASTPAFVLNTEYDHELTGSVDFNIGYRFFLVNEESGRYTHHLVTGLEFDLIGSLDFDITLVWDRIEKPRPDSDGTFPDKDDYRLNLALGFDF